jgi:hypothetical protein
MNTSCPIEYASSDSDVECCGKTAVAHRMKWIDKRLIPECTPRLQLNGNAYS